MKRSIGRWFGNNLRDRAQVPDRAFDDVALLPMRGASVAKLQSRFASLGEGPARWAGLLRRPRDADGAGRHSPTPADTVEQGHGAPAPFADLRLALIDATSGKW